MSIFHRLRPTAWASVAAGLVALGVGSFAGPAAAAPTSNLVFSVDGGTTWSVNVNAAPGQTVIAREYYDNDTAATIDGAQVTTTLPSGFSLVAGSTEVCLNPGTTDPTNPTSELECNTNTGSASAPDDQGGAIDEAAVWSGSALTISPSAGLFGQPTNQTSGPLADGMVKYLNFDQCVYTNSTTDNFTSIVPLPGNPNFNSGTNASDTATATSCGGGSAPWVPQGGTGVANYGLLGQAFFNLTQCYYTTPVTAWLDTGGGGSNTDENPTDSDTVTPACGSGSIAVNSGILSMGLLDNKYINLDECTYVGGSVSYSSALDIANSPPDFNAGSNVSTTPQTMVSCGPGGPSGYVPETADDGVLALDYQDTTRGQGFVQWSMKAPSPATTTTYTENGQLTGPGTGDPTNTGTITINASVGTPIGDAWVAGGVVAGLGIAAAAVVFVRRRTAAA